MNVSAPAAVDAAVSLLPANANLNTRDAHMPPEEVARQFESVLVRQMLQESLKPLLENGQSGQVYGYFISEALSSSFTKAGGFGLQAVLKDQLYAEQTRAREVLETPLSPSPIIKAYGKPTPQKIEGR
jgi:Rod binding domain-containing protein